VFSAHCPYCFQRHYPVQLQLTGFTRGIAHGERWCYRSLWRLLRIRLLEKLKIAQVELKLLAFHRFANTSCFTVAIHQQPKANTILGKKQTRKEAITSSGA